jgi:uncharacterized protein
MKKLPTYPLFPKGLATGKAFINRQADRAELTDRILRLEHTWIAAPRRYGKTSLLEQVCVDLAKTRAQKSTQAIHTCVIDLMLVRDIEVLQKQLFAAVSSLLVQLEPAHKKLLTLARKYLDKYVKELTVGMEGVSVSLKIDRATPDSLNETLLKLDKIATDHNIRFALIIDEFQKIVDLPDSDIIEGSIRNAVQQSKNVIYIFSGSRRSLLQRMFTDKRRPLYRLCTQLTVERISEEEYKKYIDSASRLNWNKGLSEAAYAELFAATERHPYYINSVCRKLMRLAKCPTAADIQEVWREVVDEERHWLVNEYGNLSTTQAIVLGALARMPTAKPSAKAFTQFAGLAASSVKSALDALLRDDHVQSKTNADGSTLYHVLDPGMRYILNSELS